MTKGSKKGKTSVPGRLDHDSTEKGPVRLVGSGRVSGHWSGRRALQAAEQHELKHWKDRSIFGKSQVVQDYQRLGRAKTLGTQAGQE